MSTTDVRVVRPAETRLTLAMVMAAHDTNLMGTVHGGHVMKSVDDAAGTAAARFSGGPAVTAVMDEMIFRAPVRVGDILTVHAQINWAGRTSMEVGAHVATTRWDELNEPVHVATAYLVLVAVDENGRPRTLPRLEPYSPDDLRRHAEAEIRRRHRLRMREEIDRLRALTD
ncbi:MAG: acyl-CoA thioesterase [Mobilicoccus sp.]|nr:acyl-CoA thioesterase [Mobilicoccus sp.]